MSEPLTFRAWTAALIGWTGIRSGPATARPDATLGYQVSTCNTVSSGSRFAGLNVSPV